MKTACNSVLIVCVLVVQFLSVGLTTVNITQEPYRHQARADVVQAWKENPSPTTKAAVREEIQRVTKYTSRREFIRTGLQFGGWLALDAITGACLWYYCARRRQAEPAR